MWMQDELTNDVLVQLTSVEERLYGYLQSENKTIKEGVETLLKAGGKRIRPLITLLSAQYGSADEHIIDIATMPEMIHLATLIHDDVIDMASTRRGVPTMHKKYGTDVAVFAGDLLLVSTTHRMLSYYDLASYKEFSADLMKILGAEITQMSEKANWETDLKTYLRIIEGKTARLLKLSVKLGTNYANVPSQVERELVAIVHNLGMAFQIVDDCLDYIGSVTCVGKPLYSDLENGYMTLPVILKCRSDDAFKKRLIAKKGKLTKRELTTTLDSSITEAIEIAKRYSDKAKMRVAKLPANPNNQTWLNVIDKLLTRKV